MTLDVDAPGEVVMALHVRRADAKRIKTLLEANGTYHRNFRVTNSSCVGGCLAIPTSTGDAAIGLPTEVVLDVGPQLCPYSASYINQCQSKLPRTTLCTGGTLVQQALMDAFCELTGSTADGDREEPFRISIQNLSRLTCPRSLEILGDDRTVVVPEAALKPDDPAFEKVLANTGISPPSRFLQATWCHLARLHRGTRVVRRSTIDPNSPIRQSRFIILWPPSHDEAADRTSGPGSPGWTTVTEQGIRQSFDLTRVMFSRGNISEKIRFGTLVQPGEEVLDMYGGIGYFTLPALVRGRASRVVVCEWNPDALQALEYNLRDNGVSDRACVLKGDCRRLAVENNLVDRFDRVVLGLLPSSEGGWSTAVRAIRISSSGWLHVHGNVPAHESSTWFEWLCLQLKKHLCEHDPDLSRKCVIVGHHLEKVKSFAPTVNHYVADVYIGPPSGTHELLLGRVEPPFVGYRRPGDAGLTECRRVVDAPSCALSPNGALCQDWMR